MLVAVVGTEYSGAIVVGPVIVEAGAVFVLLADAETTEKVEEGRPSVVVGSVVMSEVDVVDKCTTGPCVG